MFARRTLVRFRFSSSGAPCICPLLAILGLVLRRLSFAYFCSIPLPNPNVLVNLLSFSKRFVNFTFLLCSFQGAWSKTLVLDACTSFRLCQDHLCYHCLACFSTSKFWQLVCSLKTKQCSVKNLLPPVMVRLDSRHDVFDLGYWDVFQSQVLHRKEVIQPHLPIRLPCYDFTPIIGPTFDGWLL